uniref:ZP domain-containing protein n=1 Tax=Steinernema glaseri TaxID=37863 RepID=A0A1I8A5G4_9BILA
MLRAAFCCLLLLASGLHAAITSVPSCDPESAPVFLLQHNATTGSTLRTVHVPHLGECSEHCSKASDCVGVDFAGQECRVLGASDSAFSASEDSMTLTKTCVKSERVCSSAFHFDAYEQKLLVGFAREVVAAESIEICLAACLNSFDTYGFECESVMYYPTDQECILNTEDRLDRPDLFIDEHQDQVIYLDNNCAGSQCYAPYVTQYIAVEGRKLDNVVGIDLDVDLESCESMCTQRLSFGRSDFNCKAFMFDNATNKCTLLDERSKPLGRADLGEASDTTYFEKKCFASPRTCRNVPSFTRVPQMILVGFAAFVMENVPSVTMCLDQCTNPPPETGENFQCKSVMYYYNEQECILNAETRFSKPDLFIPEGADFQVDYFDITCHLDKEMCPRGTELRAVRTLNAELPEGEGNLHVIEGSGENVGQCLAKCFVSAPEKCRSFNFDKKTSRCNLLYLDGKTTVRPQAKTGIDLYDLHCLAVPNDCSINKDGALYSRYLHTKQAGLPLEELKLVSLNTCLDSCATKERCEGVNYNRRSGVCSLFETIDENSEPNEQVDFYKNLCVVKEVDTGASSAANVPVDPATKSHKKEGEEKHPSLGIQKAVKPVVKAKGDTRHHPQKSSEEYKGAETAAVAETTVAAVQPEATEAPTPVQVHPEGPLPGAELHVENQGAATVPVLIEKEAVQTICNYEGIKVQVKNPEAFTGVMFVKNKYDSCRVEVSNSDSATLVLGLPANFGMKPIVLGAEEKSGDKTAEDKSVEKQEKPAEELRRRRETERDCGLQDMENGMYKTTVVIQTNNLGIPGLVTSMDQIYEVACDYSSMLGGKITIDGNMTVTGPEASLIQPRGKIELGNPVLMQMNSGSGEHMPVLQAKLGDILELRWEIMAMDEELDFLVKDCFAEPGGSGREDEKLQLIEGGCPTPAVAQKLIPGPVEVQSSAVKVAHLQAFRFDSSSTVRVTCHLEICKGECQPATCPLQGEQKTSWGRKKREDNSVTQFETKRYKVPRFAQATTSLVIVEPMQTVAEPVSLSRASPLDLLQEHPLTEVVAERTGLMCMKKLTVGVVFGLLFVVTVVQLLVVAQYVFQRLFKTKKDF